ncbi:hypothetical protein FS837_004619, partial [Tulasnella sp. UAMH 9824]
IALFYTCRTYILRTLYHDLRVLSSQSLSPSSHADAAPTESAVFLSPGTTPVSLTPKLHPMDISDGDQSDSTLPQPSTSTARRKPYHFWSATKTGAGQGLGATAAAALKSEGNNSSLARTTFAVCFSESCTLFLMVLAQAAHLLSPTARRLNWDISLTILIGLILLIIPLFQCAFLTYRSSGLPESPFKNWRRALILLAPYAIYIFTVYRIPVPEALSSSGLVSTSLSRLTVIGVLILGLISGYGCVSTASMFFRDIARSDLAEPTKQELVQAEQSLFRVRSDLLERKREMQKRASQVEAAAASSESTGWFGRISFWKGTDAELTSLQREAQGLEVLEREMEKELKELHARKARIEFSKTLKGKAWKWIGWAFGLYCAFRVFSSLINIILPQRQSTAGSTRTPDLIALWLMYLLSFVPLPSSLAFLQHASPERIAAASRQISLVLVGCIVLVSVRGVLRGVGSVLRMISGNGSGQSGAGSPRPGASGSGSSRRSLLANIMLLVLAQLMGVYLLSTLIQLRNSFPPDIDSSIDKSDMSLFASLPSYEVFNSWFDWAFVTSAGCTAGWNWLRRKIGIY